MIQCLNRNEIDVNKWDTTVAGSWHETVYGYSWYLDSIAVDWCGMVLDDYRSVMPLIVGEKWGLKYIKNTSFIQNTCIYGPEPDAMTIRDFLYAIPLRYKYWDFKIYLPSKPDINKAEIRSCVNMVLPLHKDYEEIRKLYNSNTKRNIAKAHKNGVRLLDVDDPKLLVDTYIEFKKAKYNTQSSPEVYKRFKNMIAKAKEQDRIKLVYAYDNLDNFLGGTVFIKTKHRIIYLFSAVKTQKRNSGAMFLPIDAMIKDVAPDNCILDFEGSDIEGIARFYKGFGAMAEDYYHIRLNRLPKLFMWLKR